MVILRKIEIAFLRNILTQCCTKLIQGVLRIVIFMFLLFLVTAFGLPGRINLEGLHLQTIRTECV